MANQLVRRNNVEEYQQVYPNTFIDSVMDRESGVSLAEILQGFNMYFLSYSGDKTTTRLKVPASLRKEGLWITYVLYDRSIVSEWYNEEAIDDVSWGTDSNWRVASNNLIGDVSVSADGYWVINGEKTEAKAQGEQGVTPLLRIGANNKLQVSYNSGKAWGDISDYIVPRFRWNQGTGTSAGNVQISMDLGNTWTNLSNEITNNLRTSRYIGINESLPTSGVAEGAVYMKGPYYDEGDTSNANPIYRMWVYAWKGDTLAWQDNGEFTSISAGVVQETGNSETEVMSQKAVTEKLTELESKVGADVNATIIEFTDNFRFATGASPIDINSKLATSSWRCAIVECSEGEEFAINGKGGGSAAALWTFVDANGNILLQNAEQNPILQKMVIVAPSNAAYLLMNDFKSGAKSYKGVPLSFAVDALDANIVDLKKQGSDNLVHFPTLIISTNYQSLLADANTANDNTIYTIVMSSIPKNFPSDYTFASMKSDQVLLTTMVSSKGDNYEQRSQTISRADGTTIYSRVYVNGAWGTWQKVNAPLEIFPTLIISTNYQSLLADANTAKRNCIYTIEMSSIPNNFPTDYAYASVGGGQPILLKTIANEYNGAEGSIIQEIINSTSGEVVYYRRCSSGTWSDWVKKQSAPTIIMYPTFVTTSNIASIVPNADNAADNTMYRIGSRTYPSNFPPHFPSAKAPAIFLETKVVGLSGSTMKYQTIYDENMRALWVRDYNGTWGAWRSIQHFISVSKNGSGEGWSYKSLYEALEFAINNDHTFIEVYDGEYDLIAEMGDDLTDNHNGILLGHDMKLKFHPNAYVTAHYKGDSDNIKSVFSAFMVGEGDFEIDGLNLSCSNIRYCIHDDNARAYSEYKHIYRNCKMLMDNSNNTAWDSKQCIGGGLGESAVIIINNCFFESVGSENNAEVSYHNCGYGTTARSEIHISNCYFKNSTCRFGYYGNTTNITSCYVSGCRAKQKPYVFRESSGYDKVNMELFEWGNDIQ